jgi:WD40 repeat protein
MMYGTKMFVRSIFSSNLMLMNLHKITDSVLDMHLCEEIQIGVCATADGGAALFHMNDGQFFGGIILSQVSARSVLILKHRNPMDYSVLCGTSDGVIHSLQLNIHAETAIIHEENPFRVSETTDTAIKPRHVGPVMCMTSPGDGIFVSGGQDGALRVWYCLDESISSSGTDDGITSKKEPIETDNIRQTKCMYALTGYKLWLGSACTDGKRLVSDGGENSIVVRDFSVGS